MNVQMKIPCLLAAVVIPTMASLATQPPVDPLWAGRDVVSYAFEVRNTNGPTARGVAWLDKETGIPSEIEGMTLDPLPDKRLKAVTTNTRYETTEKGEWRVKEMRIEAKASAFFMTVDVVSTMTFSEYWKKPNER